MLRTTTTRLTAAVFGLVAVGAPLMGAGPEKSESRGWSFQPPAGIFGRVNVTFGQARDRDRHDWRDRDRDCHDRRTEEVLPCELKLSAFQARDTVIIVATGTNRSTGFATSFIGCDLDDRSPEVRLKNTRLCGPTGMEMTQFEVSGSFRACRPIHCIEVHIAGQCFDVRVTQAPGL